MKKNTQQDRLMAMIRKLEAKQDASMARCHHQVAELEKAFNRRSEQFRRERDTAVDAIEKQIDKAERQMVKLAEADEKKHGKYKCRFKR